MKLDDLCEDINSCKQTAYNFLALIKASVVIYAGNDYVTIAPSSNWGDIENKGCKVGTVDAKYPVTLVSSLGGSFSGLTATPLDVITDRGVHKTIPPGTKILIHGKVMKVKRVDKDKLLKALLANIKRNSDENSYWIKVIDVLEKLGVNYPEFKIIKRSLNH